MNETLLTTKGRRLSAPGIMADYSKYKAVMTTDPSNVPISDSPYQDAIYGSNAFYQGPSTTLGTAQTATFMANSNWGPLQDFQVDSWVKWDVDSVTNNDNTLAVFSSTTAFLFNWLLRGVGQNPTHQPRILNSSTFAFSGVIQPLRQWKYLSFGRSGGTLYLYVNSTKTTTAMATDPISITGQRMLIGQNVAAIKNRILFTDIRLSSIARDFNTRVIPTAPMPPDDNTMFLLR